MLAAGKLGVRKAPAAGWTPAVPASNQLWQEVHRDLSKDGLSLLWDKLLAKALGAGDAQPFFPTYPVVISLAAGRKEQTLPVPSDTPLYLFLNCLTSFSTETRAELVAGCIFWVSV